MFGLGATELVIVLVIVLLLGGATQIPKIFKALGQAKGEFEKGASETGGAKKKEEDEHVTISKSELEALRKAQAPKE
jgi:sec-independent protein translocase protein TatA